MRDFILPISVIIPTYNRSSLLNKTLESVRAQTFKEWECIVVNDGGEIKVPDFFKNDSRFKFVERPQSYIKGANSCRNFGFQISKGKYVMWLDDDDLISQNKLEEQFVLLEKNNAELATCRWERFEDNVSGIDLTERAIYKNYDNPIDLFVDMGRNKTFFPSHTYLIARSLIIRSGLWNPFLKINQDGEFFSRVILNANKIYFSHLATVFYRNTRTNKVSSFSTIEKVDHAIISWKLIENYLRLTDNKEALMYVENGKEYIYRNLINNKFKMKVLKNLIYFRKQLYNDIIFRIKKY